MLSKVQRSMREFRITELKTHDLRSTAMAERRISALLHVLPRSLRLLIIAIAIGVVSSVLSTRICLMVMRSVMVDINTYVCSSAVFEIVETSKCKT